MAIHVQYSAFIELSQCQGCMVAKSIVLSLFSTAVSATAVLILSVPGEQKLQIQDGCHTEIWTIEFWMVGLLDGCKL